MVRQGSFIVSHLLCPWRRIGGSTGRRESDVMLGEWREAVEAGGTVGGGVSAGGPQLEAVADLERQRELVRAVLVQHVSAVAGGTGEDDGRGGALARGTGGVANGL